MQKLVHGDRFYQDGAVDHVYFTDEGLQSIVAVTSDGAQVETCVVGEEGAFGLTEALANAPFFPTATTQIPGRAWKESASECRTVFSQYPGTVLVQRYARFMLAEARQSVACQAFRPLDRRLARWLAERFERSGWERNCYSPV